MTVFWHYECQRSLERSRMRRAIIKRQLWGWRVFFTTSAVVVAAALTWLLGWWTP